MPAGASSLTDPSIGAAQGLRYSALTLLFRTPLYRLLLMGRRPSALAAIPSDPWPGDTARGAGILRSEYDFAGQMIRMEDGVDWQPVGATEPWLAELHGFGWLGDLRAVAGDSARRHARDLVTQWIARHDNWDPLAWRPDIMGRRISSWLGQYEFFCASADDGFRSRFFDSLGRQSRHLTRAAALSTAGDGRLAAVKGLLYCAVCLPQQQRRVNAGDGRYKTGIRLLEQELKLSLLGDGGHASRSPSLLLWTLRDLVDIRAAFGAAGRETPRMLQNAIDRMAPMLRYFRHGDGGLALFNDSCAEDGGFIDLVLAQADARGKAPLRAPESGFERARAGRTVLLMDTGKPGPSVFGRHTHAGTLSFELSVGKDRLIVNCGAAAESHAKWRQAQRATAAHSSLTLADTNSSELLDDGRIGRRPLDVAHSREEVDGSVWLEATHDAYVAKFRLRHQRRLFLATAGDDLRGEDSLLPNQDAKGKSSSYPFALRFHLHPRVQASMIQKGTAALLRLPSGLGWRLRMQGGEMTLEDSVYLGHRGEIKRSQQVVIRGTTGQDGPGATIKWALQREGGGG